MGKLFLALVVLTFCSFSISALAVEPSMCYGAKFSEVDTPSELPAQIRQQLGVDEVGLAGMAERYMPYNVTNAVVDRKFPMRRFSMAAVSVNCILVAYEQGGNSYKVNLRIFLRDGREWIRGDKFAYQWQALEIGTKVPSTLDEMLKYSQYAIGIMYADGRAIEKNEDQALRWFKLAAKHSMFFQSKIGIAYKDGRMLNQDYDKAYKWLEPAADKEYAEALEHLGSLYANGNGVKKDEVEAFRLFRLAANSPNNSAPYKLGVMYANGRGVTANRVVAYALFQFSRSDNAWIASWQMSNDEINVATMLYKEMMRECCERWGSMFEIIDNYANNPTVNEDLYVRPVANKSDCKIIVNGKVVIIPYGKVFGDTGIEEPPLGMSGCKPSPTIADLEV